MGTTERLFMTSQALSRIIPSKLHLQEPFLAGVPGQYRAFLSCSGCLNVYDRCTALPSDIDGPRGRRTRAFTDLLLDTLDSKALWDQYGIDDDILVCTKNQ